MIYDISQELFSSVVYPGDTVPERIEVCSMERGDGINLSDIKMCAHNGTHVDAPRHFIRKGGDIASIPLDACVGEAIVTSALELEATNLTCERILLRGEGELNETLAKRLIEEKVKLIGVEGQSVGNAKIHTMLLSRAIVVLEGIRLSNVPDGRYFLFAAPLNLGHCEGAPCRAILLDDVN